MLPMPFKSALDFIHFIFNRLLLHRCLDVAASLTFTTLLSLVPLITIVLVLLTAFPAFSDFSTQIKIFLMANMMPETAGKIITGYMQQFADNAAKLTTIGSAFLGATVFALLFTINSAFNSIWQVSRARPWSQALLMYWAMLTVGPILIGGSLSLTSWLLSLSMGWTKGSPAVSLLLLEFVPLLLTTIAFTLLYLLVPNRRTPWRHALIGGLVAAVAFELMTRGFGAYITRFPTYKAVYGAFASVPIFLLWIYFSWLVVLLGAVIAASLSGWRPGEWRRGAATATELFVDALRLLRVLDAAFKTGKVENFHSLREQLRLGYEELEQVLEQLRIANIALRVGASGWALAHDLGEITIADIYRLFVFHPDAALFAGQDDDKLKTVMENLSVNLNEKMNLPLAQVFRQAETVSPANA